MKYANDFNFRFDSDDEFSYSTSPTVDGFTLQNQFANMFNTLDNLFTFEIDIKFSVPYWLANSLTKGKYFSIVSESDALQKANNLEDGMKKYAVDEVMEESKLYQKIYELSNGDNMTEGQFRKMMNYLKELNEDIEKAKVGKWKHRPYFITWYDKWRFR